MKSFVSILILVLVAFNGQTRANLDLGNLSLLDDSIDELSSVNPGEKDSATAGATAAAQEAHAIARSADNKEVKAEAAVQVTKEISSLPAGVAKDLAQVRNNRKTKKIL